MTQKFNFSPATGILHEFENGSLRGVLTPQAFAANGASVTVEAFVHGIVFASAAIARSAPDENGTIPFVVPVDQFPEVALPCLLTARVVETDLPLATEVRITDLDLLWARMMPFRASMDGVEKGQLRIRAGGSLHDPEAQVFDLRERGTTLAQSAYSGMSDDGDAVYTITLPAHMFDGAEHVVSVIHGGSGLPLTTQPLRVQLELSGADTLQPRLLLDRIEALENAMHDTYARAFNEIALDLYRHIDVVTMHQRANFEREVSALRGALGHPDGLRAPQTLPEGAVIAMSETVTGYGLHGPTTSDTGKTFRAVASRCAVLAPGLAPGDKLLRIDGYTLAPSGDPDDIEVHLNGQRVSVRVSPGAQADSWSLSAQVRASQVRNDCNLVELRFVTPGTREGPPVSLFGIQAITVAGHDMVPETET